MEPVLISTTDIQQAVALANYMYEASDQRGRFKILRVSELEQTANHDDDFALPLDDCESGTLMIDDLSAASGVARWPRTCSFRCSRSELSIDRP